MKKGAQVKRLTFGLDPGWIICRTFIATRTSLGLAMLDIAGNNTLQCKVHIPSPAGKDDKEAVPDT
jgi:hypothetical protein